ncbi:MAG: hypothetical protein A2V70_01360 [Planctomycetes bacterium RBG_13_63_9]|nr:MAG: hypothetical protein A2V70_01360 [Planctomycetes bacterium RBG_13_63_9]
MEPIPKRLRGPDDDESLRLCDLDETAWERFPPETIAELAKIVVDRVAAHHVRKVFQHRHFPRPPKGVGLETLQLENRTRRCLTREGFEDHLDTLGDYTIGQILAVRAFGPRCLVDLLSALESQRVRGGRGAEALLLSDELTAQARRLAAMPSPELVRCEDPRFARLIEVVDAEAQTANELAERLLARAQDPPDPAYAAEQVRRLADRIEGMQKLTLEEELIQVFGSTPYERNRRILISYYGWEDGRQHTLTEIGARFRVTRERIRQVCAKLTRKHKNIARILAPVMDRALERIDHRLPCPAARIEAELAEKGLTSAGMPMENVSTGAKLLGRPPGFQIVKVDKQRLAVRPDQVAATTAIVDLAKKEIYFHGLTTVDRITKLVSAKFPGRAGSDLVTEATQLIDGFAWLERSTGWFRLLPIAKHGLPRAIDKILAVAGAVTISQMRSAMARNRRLWKNPPPEKVLLGYCRQAPGVRVEGNRIIPDPPRDWRKSLTGVEAKLVSVLKEHGPVMERGAMEDLCVAGGMNRFSFHAFVSWSPVITQFGHSVYGLLGAEVSQKQVNQLIATRRAKRLAHRVLDRHGRTEDGKVWLSYRLSKAASTYAVITIPAALKKEVRGRFKLLGPEGKQIGTLATKDGRAWGLGALMRQHGAQVGDYVVVTLDLEKRTAEVALGERR